MSLTLPQRFCAARVDTLRHVDVLLLGLGMRVARTWARARRLAKSRLISIPPKTA